MSGTGAAALPAPSARRRRDRQRNNSEGDDALAANPPLRFGWASSSRSWRSGLFDLLLESSVRLRPPRCPQSATAAMTGDENMRPVAAGAGHAGCTTGRTMAVIQDLRYGLRALIRTPSVTAVAILTLTIGIGANTAAFSVIDAVLLRPL